MSTTVSAFITELDSRFPNTFASASKVAWVNDVEFAISEDIKREFRVAYHVAKADTYQYSIPTNVLWNDIYKIFVDDVEYYKKSLLQNKSNYSFYYEDSSINLYPVPTLDDEEYVSGAGEITFDTNTITTTGDEFTDTAFTAGSILKISGCTDDEDNNKYARLVSVDDDTLTFADDTFTAQAESAAVTIQQPTIKLIYRYRPTEKNVGNILTDTLTLERRFHDIYYQYCYAQMSLLRQEFNEYNAYISIYNTLVAEYMAYYEERRDHGELNVQLDGTSFYTDDE